MYRIEFARDVVKDLKRLNPYHRNQILEEIENNLLHEPLSLSKNRKLLVNLIPPWDAVSPIWELRVGEYRIFYDVDSTNKIVYIRAVRKKPHGKTTEEIL